MGQLGERCIDGGHDCGARFGAGARAPESRPAVRGLLYDQAARPGSGAGDQPPDYRGTRRPAVGDCQCAPGRWRGVHGADRERGGGMMDAEALVFVVDDDASMRESLQNLLRSVGLRVEAFTSAQEFLRRTRPEVPSCLVLDVRLPGLSGLELQQRLAAGDLAIPIIFITGYGDIPRSEEHTSELQSLRHLVCRLLLEK